MAVNSRVYSPLRYPGSKSKVVKKIRHYLEVPHKEYREPFIGGASIFLFKDLAPINWINDKDINIATLWQVIKENPEELCELVMNIYPTIELWHKIKWSSEFKRDPVKKAFRCLFLNRTNYSGILKANPIGGLNQESNYPIDCRWKPDTLVRRIKEASQKLKDVRITDYDFTRVITEPGEDVLMVIDPPYYQKGSQLYPTYMTPGEHKILAELLKDTQHKFLLTIDDCSEIRKLYEWAKFVNPKSWYYTIRSKGGSCTLGKELFITNIDLEAEEAEV